MGRKKSDEYVDCSDKSPRVSIVGSGVVGLSVGQGLLKLGAGVVFYDVDSRRIDELKALNLTVQHDIQKAVLNSDLSFVCVPTPASHDGMNLTSMRSSISSIGKALRRKKAYHVVVIKSTVLPTTTEKEIIPLLEKSSGKKVGLDIGVCSNPEFLTEIHHTWTDDESFARRFGNERFAVIGELDHKSGDALHELYLRLKVPIIRTNLRTAEMIKFAFNCALACKISYWNEIFYICRKIGVDPGLVASTSAIDERIGKYGTIHGKAFGGKCLPKDLHAFIQFSESLGYSPKLLAVIEQINLRIAADFGIRQ